MADCVAIAPELPFKQQVREIAAHLSRSIPNASDPNAVREFLNSIDATLKLPDGQTEPSSETKKDVVKDLVGRVVELKGGLEAAKEGDAESSHLLLQLLLSTTFETTSNEYEESVKKVISSVQSSAENAASSGRMARVEAATRILNNTYNYLPPQSSLRPTTLLALLSTLSLLADTSAIDLSSTNLQSALNQWSISSSEKINFLISLADIYQSSGSLSKAQEVTLLALSESVDPKVVEKAIILSLADDQKFDLDDILRIQGVKEQVTGKLAELVGLFTETDELEAVGKGQSWIEGNSSFFDNAGVSQLTAESISHKLRLIALTTLCARSSSKQVAYADVAKALAVPESEVEAWVIDAIRANLLKARLSQPTSIIRITHVSSSAIRKFGSEEWQLLERRLSEWKKSVEEARRVIDEAEAIAAQGPLTHSRRPQQKQQQQQQQQQPQQSGAVEGQRREEEIAA